MPLEIRSTRSAGSAGRSTSWSRSSFTHVREPLRLCPERWLGTATHGDLRASLAPVLKLPLSRVLVSHGEPVLRGGARALEGVLEG